MTIADIDPVGNRQPLDATAATNDMVRTDDHSVREESMGEDVIQISATEFKAKCLGLFKELEAHRYRKVVITRRGKPIAELTPSHREVPELWGALKGRVIIPPGVDLTDPVLEDIPEAAQDMSVD